MPFQGNPNAGQPDPGLLNLLFQEKARREENQFKQQQAMIKAQAEAEAAAAENARKDELHRAKMAKLAVETINASKAAEEQIGGLQKTGRQVKADTAKSYPVTDYAQPVLQGGPLPAGIFPLTPQDEANVGVQKQVGQNVDDTINARYAALATSLKQFPGFEGYANSIPMQGAMAQMNTERIDQEALQKTLDEEARNKIESDRVARRDDSIAAAGEQRRARIAAKAETDKIKAREVELQTLSNKIASPKVTGQERELAESQYRAIKAEADAQLTANQAPEVVTENRKRANENFEYDQVYDQSRAVRGLIQRLESGDTKSIGAEAWASEVLGNFKNLVQTTSSMPFIDRYSASLNAVLENPANTTAEKQKIIDTYFSQENLDRIASGNLTEQEMQWWFMYSLNPDGRVSNMLAKDTQNNVQIIGPLVGPKLALSRLRAMATRQDQFLRRRRSYISKVDKTEAFDPADGRRVASESLPWPKTGSVASPAVPGLTPKMSPEEAANAILGAPN